MRRCGDVAGLAPGVGILADLTNAGISVARGNYADAALSMSAAVPLAGTVAGIAKIAKTASKLNKGTPKYLYHYTGTNPQRIATEGLKPGASGKVFTTPKGDLSPMQAQIDLALPPNRGLPNHLLEIDVSTLQKMGVSVPKGTQVGRSFNMPGGGIETVFPHAIPSEAIKVIRR